MTEIVLADAGGEQIGDFLHRRMLDAALPQPYDAGRAWPPAAIQRR
jgi:hypothetical protein